MSASRVDLDALSGLRFFATLGIVAGHAVETLWIDNGNEFEWLSKNTCSAFRRSADDLVSFYFILAGFGIHWGYSSRSRSIFLSNSSVVVDDDDRRDLEGKESRIRYWIRRAQRFYPDLTITTVIAMFLEALSVFSCHTLSALGLAFNFTSFILLGAWLMVIPGAGYINGPSWFIVTLAWLWIAYPFVVGTVKSLYKSDSVYIFLGKLILVWFVSMIPWLILLAFSFFNISFGFITFGNLTWGIKGCPLFRLGEFVIGIAIAMKLKDDQEYEAVEDSAKDQSASPWASPLLILLGACAACLAAIGLFHVISLTSWNPHCNCLDVNVRCYGWLQFIDSRFALVSALIIYTVASLELASIKHGESRESALRAKAGFVGWTVWSFFTWKPFSEVNKWGLQAFLYQSPVQTLFQSLLVDVHIGLSSRCAAQPLRPHFAIFYVGAQLALTYLVAWLMHDGGPIGQHVHALAGQAAAALTGWLAGGDDPSRRKTTTIQYA